MYIRGIRREIMDSFKQELVLFCKNQLNRKIIDLAKALQDVTEAGNNETKSTAGDKHETGRAMMQLEQEKLGRQLQEAEGQFAEFEKINFNLQSDQIVLGSLIETDKGLFLMATSIGRITVASKIVFVISPQSPLGKLLLAKKLKDTVIFNGVSYEVLSIA